MKYLKVHRNLYYNEDFKDIHNILYGARDSWKSLGIALRIPFNTLMNIEGRIPPNTDKRYKDVLTHWLLNGKNRTWKTLVSALQSKSVGRPDLARKIRQHYMMTK